MCGRFVSSHSPDAIAQFFGASFDGESQAAPEAEGAAGGGGGTPSLPPNFNVAPTDDVYAVVETKAGRRELQTFHWGLVPSWAKDVKIGSKMINARAETINEKPAFKGLFKKHRLIVPMDGFYEWQQGGAGAPLGKGGKPLKTPMFVHRADGQPLAVAGLWATWRDPAVPDDAPGEQKWLHSCTVITTAANGTMTPVHDRMPVLLPAEAWAEWLDPGNTDLHSLAQLLVPAPDDVLTMHAVSTAVNNVRNKGKELIEPTESQGSGELALGL
ncbi:MAG: SOS response-associated peptidase [Actinomycetota bacterium]|nr:SOS response-associated peptidase [Actinomycetota bacterium]